MRGLVFALLTVAVAFGVTPVVAQASSAPAISAAPSTGLVSGQAVTVTGSGFGSKQEIAGVECLNGAADPTQCDLGNLVFATADTHGAFTTTFIVQRTLFGETGFVDCGASACELRFATLSDFNAQATTALTFAPSTAPPAIVRVKPSSKLVDRQTVSVRGGGYLGGDGIEVTECVTATFSCGPSNVSFADAHGKIFARLQLSRMLPNVDGTRFDCASAQGACEIIAFDGANDDYHATAALKFDAKLPPPPAPTFGIAPNTKLPFYARVSVGGKHWASNDGVFLVECDSSLETCADVGFAFTDNSGTLAGTPMLQREIANVFDPAGPPVDCAARGAHCVVIAQGSDGDTATEPVFFDRNAPIPPAPTASIVPSGPYTNNQVVLVKGHNFAPNAGFSVGECAESASEIACFGSGGSSDVTTAKGGLSTQVQLARRIETGPGSFISCLGKGVVCTLQIVSEGGAEVDLPLTFSPPSTSTNSAADTAAAPLATSVTTPVTTRGLGWATSAHASCTTTHGAFRLPHSFAASPRLDLACRKLGRTN